MTQGFTGAGNLAPVDATYIVQTSNTTLTNEQVLASLATGLVKNTTGTGVLSIAVEGTDYWAPGGTDVAVSDGGTGASSFTDAGVLIGNGTGAIQVTSAGTSGQVLTSNGAGVDPTFQAAAGGGAWSFVSSTTISSDTEVDITGLTTGLDYMFVFQNVLPATDAVALQLLTSTDGGSTFDTGASDYRDARTGGQSEMRISSLIGNATGEGVTGDCTLFNPGDSTNHTYAKYKVSVGRSDNDFVASNSSGGRRAAAEDVDAVRFRFDSGNLASGTIRVYSRSLS